MQTQDSFIEKYLLSTKVSKERLLREKKAGKDIRRSQDKTARQTDLRLRTELGLDIGQAQVKRRPEER